MPNPSEAVPHEVRVYSEQFRIYGVVHAPPRRTVASTLNQPNRSHLTLSRCMVYAPGPAHPPDPRELLHRTDFAAVPLEHLRWLVGGPETERGAAVGAGDERRTELQAHEVRTVNLRSAGGIFDRAAPAERGAPPPDPGGFDLEVE